MASQSALTRKKSVEDILEENTKKLDKFAIDSSKKDAELTKNIKSIHTALDNIKLYVRTALANKSPEASPTSSPATPPPPVEDTSTKPDKANKIIGAWVPPETSQQKEEKKTNKSVLKQISSGVLGLKKSTSLLATKDAIRSMLPTNPFMMFIKALLSPAGILLMYFIGKMFKKHIWDPYVGPVLRFYNDYIKPVIDAAVSFFRDTALPWLKDVAWPFFTSLLPSFEEVKTAFKGFTSIFNSNASFVDKLLAGLNLIDTILAPLTNLIKWANSELLGIIMKVTDMLGMKDTTLSLLQSQNNIIDSMHGEFRDARKKELLDSEMGKKYAAAIDKTSASALNEKIKAGGQLTADEERIVRSDKYKEQYGDSAKNIFDLNRAGFEGYLQIAKTKNENLLGPNGAGAESAKLVANQAMSAFQATGLKEAQKILGDLNNKTFKSQEEAAEYMKKIVDKNEILARSSEAQNLVLKAIVQKLDSKDPQSEEIKDMIKKLDAKAALTKTNTTLMVNNAISTIKQEKPVINR